VTETFQELDKLGTDELRERAFALAEKRHDVKFFWRLFEHLPRADEAAGEDWSGGSIASSVSDAVALWREWTRHEYGAEEPIIRAAFLEYLTTHG
jgi:hypothetical protein